MALWGSGQQEALGAGEWSWQSLEKKTRSGKKSQGTRMPSIEVLAASAAMAWLCSWVRVVSE